MPTVGLVGAASRDPGPGDPRADRPPRCAGAVYRGAGAWTNGERTAEHDEFCRIDDTEGESAGERADAVN